MKYFGIAIGVAILHRLLVVGVALLGFGIGMSAFNGPSHTELVNSLFFLSGILDFPATIIGFISHFISQQKIPLSDGPLGFAAASFSLPIFWRIICSLVIGVSVSYSFYRRDFKKRGGRSVPIWKSGL